MDATGEASKSKRSELRIFPTSQDLARAAAEECTRLALEAVEARGRFSLALAGGSTPKRLYAQLAAGFAAGSSRSFPWKATHFFWGDERHVSPDHPDSNYRMAFEAMFSKVPVPASHLHRIQGEATDARAAADAYEKELRRHFGGKPGIWPQFDLVLLGLGSDGHTASLFPATDVLSESERLAAAVWVPKLEVWRVTLTVPLLNQAANIIVLVSGKDKAEALRAVRCRVFQPYTLPAQLIQPVCGRLQWLVDREAASLL